MIVEDDRAVVLTLRAILEQAGHHVEQASGVREALAAIERAVFDVAVIDLRLGQGDGLTVLRRLKETSPGVAGLILTGYGSLETAIEAFRAGAFDVLLKPANPDELLASIARSLDSRAQREDMTVLNAALRKLSQEMDELRRVAEDRADRLEELDRLKEEFIATASHDLLAPLTSIKGYAQLLLRRMGERELDADIIAQGLSVIEAQTTAMTRMLDDLLDASRIQAGAFDLRTAPCEFADCLTTVLAGMSEDERARIEVTLPGDVPFAGEWERSRIEQVLANLIRNALKYSPSSERVSVTAERRDGEIEVVVTDRGIGLPATEVPRLFERFYRTPQAIASGLPGIGLGLYICRGIVAAHGGRLWAESPGVASGATFRFTLPAVAANRIETAQDPSA